MAVSEAAVVLSNPAMLAGVIGAMSVLVVIIKHVSSSNGKKDQKVNQDVPTLPKLGPPPVFKDTDPDIVVVGGGIAGASFAARFGMEGKKVIMIEKDMGTDRSCRGEVMLPGGFRQLETMDMKDALDGIDGNPVAGEVYMDVRYGGDPGFVYYPKPGAMSLRHGFLVNALRKKAIDQESVTVIEAVGKELIKENGRVVGVKYQKKGDEIKEIRAPLVVVGDGYYSKLSQEFRTTHKPASDDLCIALDLKDYKFKYGQEYLEFAIGHPTAQVCVYRLRDNEYRSFFFVKGQTPLNLKEFCEHEVIPHAPEHMREYLTAALVDGVRVVRCKRMAANFDVTPGVLIIGDALNTRHPVTASGMTVALNDVRFWWDVLVNKVNGLTDDEGILKQKLIFRKQRQKWAFSINVLAEITIRLYRDHDASTIKLQQYFIQGLRDLKKEGTTQKEKDDVYNVIGLVDTDKDLIENVLDDIIKGTIDRVYETRPYLAAMWESRQIRKRWQEIVSDVMSQEGMT